MKIINKFRNAVAAFNATNGENINFDDLAALWSRWGGKYGGTALSEITYFTCLKTISEAVAKLPLKLYRETEQGIIKAKDKPLYNKLKIRPNPNMSATTFWAAVVNIIYHYGNCYVYINDSKHGTAPELIILDNSYMTVYYDDARIISNTGGLWYVYSEPTTGRIFKFHKDEILHFKTYMSFDGLCGLSVRDILRVTIDGALDAQNFISGLYKSGLTGKATVEYTADLSEPLRKQAIKTVEAAVDANRSINFIPVPYGMRINPLNIKLTDAQFLELKKYTSLQIAAAFGIKPNQLNDYEKSSYANSEQQQQAFLTDTLLVLLKGIEEELTEKLLFDSEIADGYFFRFNVDVILRADFATRMEGYAKARQNGWLNANEIREKENMSAIPDEDGGNMYLVNGNMIPINKAGSDIAAEIKEDDIGNEV